MLSHDPPPKPLHYPNTGCPLVQGQPCGRAPLPRGIRQGWGWGMQGPQRIGQKSWGMGPWGALDGAQGRGRWH